MKKNHTPSELQNMIRMRQEEAAAREARVAEKQKQVYGRPLLPGERPGTDIAVRVYVIVALVIIAAAILWAALWGAMKLWG